MPYPHYIIGVARKLRKNSTPAEEWLWKHLRNRKLGGLKFDRQHPFNRYIVDFYCAELKLVIEIEGGVHRVPAQIEYDQKRFEELELRGLKILRFSNEEVLQHTNEVLNEIKRVKSERGH
jgi:very-short-patch-repair endonuclease